MYNAQAAARAAKEQFRDARLRARIAALLDSLFNRSNRLLPLDEVRQRIRVRGQRSIGVQTVAVSQVVGSEGRYADFDRRFLPLTDALRQRWANIGQAMLLAIELPPVELYKVGEIYFVRDGNHRISVARRRGQNYVDAIVTELLVDVPLDAGISWQSLLLKEEYSDFLEWTELAQLRPEQRIEFSEQGGYIDLIQHINGHRYFMGQAQQRDISVAEVVTDWYDTVYMPIIEVVRELNVLRHFPRRTEADLYRWIVEHRWYQRENSGTEPDLVAAVSSYVKRSGRNRLGWRLREALRARGIRLELPWGMGQLVEREIG